MIILRIWKQDSGSCSGFPTSEVYSVRPLLVDNTTKTAKLGRISFLYVSTEV
jgi:hypothetical protein